MTALRTNPKNTPALPVQPNGLVSRWSIALAGAIVVFAALVAYHNSFSGLFIFDDPSSITENLNDQALQQCVVAASVHDSKRSTLGQSQPDES